MWARETDSGWAPSVMRYGRAGLGVGDADSCARELGQRARARSTHEPLQYIDQSPTARPALAARATARAATSPSVAGAVVEGSWLSARAGTRLRAVRRRERALGSRSGRPPAASRCI